MKGSYTISVKWDPGLRTFIARAAELAGVVGVGKSPDKAVSELLERGSKGNPGVLGVGELKPFSGQTRLRLPKGLHAELADEAQEEGVSLNTYIVQLLSRRNALNRIERRLEELGAKLNPPRNDPRPQKVSDAG